MRPSVRTSGSRTSTPARPCSIFLLLSPTQPSQWIINTNAIHQVYHQKVRDSINSYLSSSSFILLHLLLLSRVFQRVELRLLRSRSEIALTSNLNILLSKHRLLPSDTSSIQCASLEYPIDLTVACCLDGAPDQGQWCGGHASSTSNIQHQPIRGSPSCTINPCRSRLPLFVRVLVLLQNYFPSTHLGLYC